jgi:hypothetical protein
MIQFAVNDQENGSLVRGQAIMTTRLTQIVQQFLDKHHIPQMYKPLQPSGKDRGEEDGHKTRLQTLLYSAIKHLTLAFYM